MQKDPEIVFHKVDRSDALEQKISQRIERLERYADNIISCRVAVDCPHRHKNKGNLYDVAVELKVPGKQLVVNRSPDDDHSHEDVYVAIRDAFDAAERQLKEYSDRQKNEVKTPEGPPRGTVARLFPDDGYGFITPQTGSGHVYFHQNAVVNESFEALEVGTPVRFNEEEGEDGPQASAVHVLGRHQTVPGT